MNEARRRRVAERSVAVTAHVGTSEVGTSAGVKPPTSDYRPRALSCRPTPVELYRNRAISTVTS